LALLEVIIIDFALSATRMLGTTWNKRKCFIKTVFCVSDRFYQSTEDKPTFGLGQVSTAASGHFFLIPWWHSSWLVVDRLGH
jgi:hypothetical protein